MKTLLNIFTLSVLIFSTLVFAEETDTQSTVIPADAKIGFISDDLFLYFHSGPGTQYRILGTISAGEEVQVTSEVKNDYIQIVDEKNRQGWIDAAYLTDTPGLRIVLAELNEDLANKSVEVTTLVDNLAVVEDDLANTKQQLKDIQITNTELDNQNTLINAELDDKDLNMKVTWFSYGAGVLVLGLLLGLILPKFFNKKSSYSSWG